MNTQFKYINITLRAIVAVIYLQTLYYKFSAHPDSVYIFSRLGLEPYGRIGLGIVELITAILIFIPKTSIYGMMISTGVISGAIFSHLGPLGIEVLGDGGKVFYLAVIVFVLSILYLAINVSKVRITFSNLLIKKI